MSDRIRTSTLVTVLLVAVAFSVYAIGPVNAWYPAAHNRLGEDLGQSGGVASQYVDELGSEAGWPDSNAAEDGNGTYGISEEQNPWQDKYLVPFCCSTANYDHWYDVGLNTGTAPGNAKRFIGWAAQWYINNGYTNYGFKVLGRGYHYPQDMSMPYHTGSVENLAFWEHFQYEKWHKNNYDKHDFATWQEWGAVYGDANVSSDADIKSATKTLANKSHEQLDDVTGGNWGNEVWATQYNMYYLGEYAGAMSEYAAPGHFSF